MNRALPARPDLDRLRREARALQRACLAGDGQAARRLAAVSSEASPRQIALTTAQTVVAREYGFASWPKLKAHVEAAGAPVAAPAARDLDAEALAEGWFTLAEAGDLAALGRAFAIGKTRTQAAREVMRRDPARYQAFVQTLVDGLASRRVRVRFTLAHALDTFGDEHCRPHLIPLMEDPVPRVRWMAMHALSCHACGDKPGALEPEVEARIGRAALGDPSIKVRRNAVLALGTARAHADLLRELAATDADVKVRRNAEWALTQISKPV
jgi:hypothetical protein